MLWLVVMVVLALLLPANAAAHGRGPVVALDDRLVVGPPVEGISVRVLDGDRSLEVTVEPGHTVVVRGLLDEPMIRFTDGAVEANRESPTANADRIVTPGTGWKRVARGRSFAWHDHRLSPPAHGGTGTVGRWPVPLTIDGHPAAIRGTFVGVAGPNILPVAPRRSRLRNGDLRRCGQAAPLGGRLSCSSSLSSLPLPPWRRSRPSLFATLRRVACNGFSWPVVQQWRSRPAPF